MIADKVHDFEVESTVQGEKIAMQIDPEATLHLMSVLTDLYSDPEYAIVREYSTNALDAHVEAGVTRPIEVSTPTPLSPFLRIKDYGVGLDVEGIREIYSQYGASTKRGTNEQTGMLGLGCKSALTYASQFTVVGVKDHVRTTVSVGRDEDGAGVMTVVETIPTTEPNGVEVVIPTKPHNNIEAKARTLFSYWAEGTVLLNGKEPERVEGLQVTDEILLVPEQGRNRVVMGGVPYPADFPLGSDLRLDGVSIVAFVSIGAVNFTPAREALMMTSKTKATLARIVEEFKAKVGDAVQKQIAEADRPVTALRLANRYRESIKGLVAEYKFKGEEIPTTFKDDPNNRWTITNRYSLKKSQASREQYIYTATALSALWVHGWDYSSFTASHKNRLKLYCEQNNIEATTFILTKDKVVSEWIADDQQMEWEPIRQIVLPHQRRASTQRVARIPGSYDVYEGTTYRHGLPGDDIDQTKPIYFFNTTYEGGSASTAAELLFGGKRARTGYVVELTNNRVEKFKRLFPKAKPVKDGLRKVYKRERKRVTDDEIATWSLHQNYYSQKRYRRLDASRIDDPEMVALIKLAADDLDEDISTRINRVNNLARLASQEAIVASDSDILKRRYPLAEIDPYGSGPIHAHNYIYMNAVFAASQTTTKDGE